MAIAKILTLQDEAKKFLASKKERKHFDLCSDQLILLFVSMAYNAAKGTLNLTAYEKLKLAPYKKLILQLGHCKSTIKQKRALLNKNCKQSLQAIKALHEIVQSKIKNKLLK